MCENYEELTLKKVAEWAASTAMIIGGVVPFVPQYWEIKKKEDTEGFSLYVCLALLIANTLRILFWYGARFEIPLLLQSILMIATMFLMIKVCVDVRAKQQITKQKERVFTDLDTKFFWKWTDFQSYVDFMLLFGFVAGVIMYLLSDVKIFVQAVGLLALLTEAMLGLPQFIRNFRNKSTEGMSMAMVFLWLMGDTFKTCYFVQRESPLQFVMCGTLQILIDLSILIQVYIYKNNLVVVRPARAD